MRAVVVESFIVGLLLVTAACVSSATADSGGGTTGGMVGGGADGSLNGSPPALSGNAQEADLAVCATLTTQDSPDARTLNKLAHRAKGPLSLLVSAQVMEIAGGRSAVDVSAAISTMCGGQPVDAGAGAGAGAENIEVCDALGQDWLAAADQTVAAGNDAGARAGAVRDLAVRATVDVAPLQQGQTGQGVDDHSAKLLAAVRGIGDGSTTAAQSAIVAAAECSGLRLAMS